MWRITWCSNGSRTYVKYKCLATYVNSGLVELLEWLTQMSCRWSCRGRKFHLFSPKANADKCPATRNCSVFSRANLSLFFMGSGGVCQVRVGEWHKTGHNVALTGIDRWGESRKDKNDKKCQGKCQDTEGKSLQVP